MKLSPDKIGFLILIMTAWFILWHDEVAYEERRIGLIPSIVQSPSIEEPIHNVNIGHGGEVRILHPWLFDMVPLTSSLLFPVMFFGYNLLILHIIFLGIVLLPVVGGLVTRRPI